MITKGDKLLIVLVLVSSIFIYIAFYAYGFSKDKVYAIIEVDGKPYQKIILGSDGPDIKIDVTGYMGNTIVEVKRDKIRVVSSHCPDKNCVLQGWISKPGEMIVCLPNRVVVWIDSQSIANEIDAKTF